MKALTCLSTALLICTSAIHAQDATAAIDRTEDDTAIASDPGVAMTADIQQIGSSWSAVQTGTDADDTIRTLEAAGVPVETLGDGSEDSVYNIYSRYIAPGLASYLVVPQGAGKPQQFYAPSATPALFDYDADDIREEIVQGMQASIDALCAMPARPTEIRAQASAFGILEIEATWMADDVCSTSTP